MASELGPQRFNMAIETQELLKAAQELQPGDTLPNDEIVRITGRALDDCAGIAATVRKRILRDHNRVVCFGPTKYGGMRCLTDSERVDLSSANVKAVGRKMRRTSVLVVGADDANLSEQDRLAKATIGTVCKLMLAVHGKSKQLTNMVTPGSGQLRIGETLTKLFRNHKE